MNEVTLTELVDHLQAGGSTDKKVLAGIIGCTTRSTKTIENYLAACGDEDDLLDGIEIGAPTDYQQEDPEESESESEEETEEDEDDLDEEEEQAPAPEPEPPVKVVKPKVKAKAYRFFLEKEDGTSIELDRIPAKSAGTVVTFKEKAVQDLVTLMIKGEVVTVDIIPLRRLNPAGQSEYGISNELLLNLALAAR